MERKLDKIIEAINKAVLSNVVIYDMSELTPYYDYSIIASCKNHNQGQAACGYLKDEASKLGMNVRNYSASNSSTWFLVDLGEVVVHIFVGEERFRYRLDDLYSSLPHQRLDE